MRKLITTSAIAALGVVGLAAPSWAHDGWHAVEPWRAIDTASDGEQTDSEHSHIPFSHSAEAVWVDGEPASAGGTSIETPNLGLDVEAGDVVEVDYALLDGADPSSGSARLFIYMRPDADTVTERPDEFVAVPDDALPSGKISLTVPEDGTIGTAGVVYDTSNGGVEGTVRFADMIVDDQLVSFLPPPEVESQKPKAKQYECSDDDNAGELLIPDVEGVGYSHESGPVPAGTYEINAEAAEGYSLTGETEWVLTVEPVDECEEPGDVGGGPGDQDGNGANGSSENGDKAGKVADSDDTEQVSSEQLAQTGASAGQLALIGGIVVALGVAAFVLRRYIPLPGGRYRS